MHSLLVGAAYPWSGLDPRARRAVTAVELCFPGTEGLYSSMEWFLLLHCQVAVVSWGSSFMLCAAIQTRLFELDLTLGKAGAAPALLQASCVAFGNVFIHPTLQFSSPKKQKWESCSCLPRDWEVKLLQTGKCWIWGAVRCRDVLVVCVWLERVRCSCQPYTKADVWDVQIHFLMLLFTLTAFFFSLCKIMTF